MAYKQGKNPFSRSPLNFSSPLNSFDSLVGKLMNQGKSKEAATKIAGKVANAKMKGAGSGPTAAQKARAKGSPAKQAKPDFLDLDKDGNTTEPMKDAAKSSPANLKEKSPAKLKEKSPAKLKEKSPAKLKEKSPAKLKSPAEKKLVGKQKNLPEGLRKAIEAAPESPAKMKSPMKKHSDAHIKKEAKRIARKNKGDEQDIYYELKSKYAQEKKDAAKKDAKGSPAKRKSVKQTTRPVSQKAIKRAKALAKGDTKKYKRLIKAAGKVGSQSPAKNKVEGLSHDELANKTAKGYKRHMETHKSADKHIDPKKREGKATRVIKDRKKTADLLNAKNPPSAKTRLKKSGVKADSPANLKGKKVAKAAGSAIAGAAVGAAAGKMGKAAKKAVKKKSPLNNAYENPEYFVPTKSSYGQDMDNFFNTVGKAYEDRKTYGKGLKGKKGDPFADMTKEEAKDYFVKKYGK